MRSIAAFVRGPGGASDCAFGPASIRVGGGTDFAPPQPSNGEAIRASSATRVTVRDYLGELPKQALMPSRGACAHQGADRRPARALAGAGRARRSVAQGNG